MIAVGFDATGLKLGGAGGIGLGDFLGGALGDDLAAGVAGFGADVEDPVGLGGDGHVVLG